MKRPGLAALLVFAAAGVGVLIILVATLVSSGETEIGPRLKPENSRPLVRVAGKEITQFHLDVAQRYQTIRGGYKMPDYGLIREMLERATGEEILRKYRRGITPEDVAAERARMERESRDRDKQRQIMHELDQYPGMFEMLVVRPVLVNQRIYAMQSHDRTLQKDAFEAAEAGLKEALRDKDYFRRMKEEAGERYVRMDSRVPPGPPDGPPQPPEILEQHAKMAKEWVANNLPRTAPGEVKPETVDFGGAVLVVRLVEKDDDHVVYEHVAFPKASFDKWRDAELKQIPVEILDPSIREELKQGLKDSPFGRWLFGD